MHARYWKVCWCWNQGEREIEHGQMSTMGSFVCEGSICLSVVRGEEDCIGSGDMTADRGMLRAEPQQRDSLMRGIGGRGSRGECSCLGYIVVLMLKSRADAETVVESDGACAP